MNVDNARRILLIRAIEENDPDGEILNRVARERATIESRSGSENSDSELAVAEKILSQRAEILCRQVESSHPRMSSVFRGVASGLSSWLPVAAVVAVWLVISAVSKGVWAPGNSINILVVPLLVLFLWNVCIVVINILFALCAVLSSKPRTHGLLAALSDSIDHLRLGRLAERLAASRKDDFERWRTILAQFSSSWATLVRPLHGARVRCALHVGACALVAGEFLYVYVKGVNVEFVATWESTWLSAQATHDVLTVLLWPAWWLLGDAIPSANEIKVLKEAEPNAAFWINLYLVQACVIVFVPRVVLAAIELRRIRRLERSLPLVVDRDRYYLNLVQVDRGSHTIARVLPYSFHPSSKSRDAIHTLLKDDLGYSAHVEIAEPVSYGTVELANHDDTSNTDDHSRCWVILFNLAQTPEHEVQGQFISSVIQAAQRSSKQDRVAVLVDDSAYRERLAGEPEIESRIADRQLAWTNLVKEHDTSASFFDREQSGARKANLDWQSNA